jgi:hypothetical protein
MKKVLRNMSTPESREFWAGVERSAAVVRQWPSWKRAGINEAQLREPRVADDATASTDAGADD